MEPAAPGLRVGWERVRERGGVETWGWGVGVELGGRSQVPEGRVRPGTGPRRVGV